MRLTVFLFYLKILRDIKSGVITRFLRRGVIWFILPECSTQSDLKRECYFQILVCGLTSAVKWSRNLSKSVILKSYTPYEKRMIHNEKLLSSIVFGHYKFISNLYTDYKISSRNNLYPKLITIIFLAIVIKINHIFIQWYSIFNGPY